MEYVIIGMILFILATGTMWYRDAQVKNRLYEKLLKGHTPREVELNLPNDGRIFVNEDLNRDILLVLNEWYVLDTAVDKSVVN